jgi:hypothetical protein
MATEYAQSSGMSSTTATDNVAEGTPVDGVAYTQTAGMYGPITTDDVSELSSQAVDAAAAASTSAASAAASATTATTAAASLSVNATSVTLAGALMDSELSSIADVKALNQSVASGATPALGVANMTLDDTSLVVSDTTNMQTFAEGVDSALLRARGTGYTSTYAASVTVGGTTFAQPAVKGEIASDLGYFPIDYAGATGVTVATGAVSVYVYIDSASNLQQQTTEPTRQDWSRKMFTMRISVNTVTGNIIGFEYLANPIGHYANSARDLYGFLLAAGLSLRKGQAVTGRTDGLGFDAGAGSVFEYGGTGDIHNPNIKSFDAVSNVEFDILERVDIAAENQTSLVKSWDNAGTITALGSTTVAGYRLYRFSNGQFAMQYGQGNYANMTLARAGVPLEEYVLNPRLLDATFLGWWFIESTATVTSGTPTLTFFQKYTIGIT